MMVIMNGKVDFQARNYHSLKEWESWTYVFMADLTGVIVERAFRLLDCVIDDPEWWHPSASAMLSVHKSVVGPRSIDNFLAVVSPASDSSFASVIGR